MHDRHDLFQPQPYPHDLQMGDGREDYRDDSWSDWSTLGDRHVPHEPLSPLAEQNPGLFTAPDFDLIDRQWDPEAELAQLLQPPADIEDPAGSGTGPGSGAEHDGDAAHSAPAPVRHSFGHRRHKIRRPMLPWPQTLSYAVAALTAAIVAMVSVLGGMIAYDPLRHLATPGSPQDLAHWWPLLVYGPWMVASLSILRSALHQRRAPHSWAVVLFFSAVAVVLCVAHAPKSFTGASVAGLPPVAALTCFHQLVRQITLTKPPRHGVSRQRENAQRRS